MTQSLYDQIGGASAVEAAVDLFYRKVLTDDLISHFFDDTDMDEQRAKQKAFLTLVLGGPHEYTGKDLRTAHAPLVEKGLDDLHCRRGPSSIDARGAGGARRSRPRGRDGGGEHPGRRSQPLTSRLSASRYFSAVRATMSGGSSGAGGRLFQPTPSR